MRNAYSNLLGEYVAADQVEHSDTHGFQVVCPCCRESVFKVQRAETDFFSHRQAAKSVVSDCERRVGGLSPSAIAATNAESRGQTLKVFLSVIRNAIDLDDNANMADGVRGSFQQQRKIVFDSKRLSYFDEFAFRTHRDCKAHDWIQDGIDVFNTNTEMQGLRVGTSFSGSIQARIARDVMRSMMNEQGRRNHSYLVRHALSRASHSTWTQNGVTTTGTAFIQKVKQAINKPTEIEVRRALIAWDHEPAPHGLTSYAAYALHRIECEMLGTLMRLPYREMLENHRQGLGPLTALKDRLGESREDSMGLGFAPAM